MKKLKILLVLILIQIAAGVIPTHIFCQQRLFLWGNVIWGTSYPARHVEVRLVQTTTQATKVAFTNESGRFAFFDIEGQPSEYSLQVYTGTRERASTPLPALEIGSQAPDLIIN